MPMMMIKCSAVCELSFICNFPKFDFHLWLKRETKRNLIVNQDTNDVLVTCQLQLAS